MNGRIPVEAGSGGSTMFGIGRLPWFWIIGGAFHFLLLIGLLILIVVGIWALIRSASRPSRSYSSASTTPARSSSLAMEILQERYARGEINKEEYERIKSDLNA
jgi:putative membrane protein